LVGVFVGVFVGVIVGVRVGVFVGVLVGVIVGVTVGELVGVAVGVGVGALPDSAALTLKSDPDQFSQLASVTECPVLEARFFGVPELAICEAADQSAAPYGLKASR
jgi:uncharacterized membrane protein